MLMINHYLPFFIMSCDYSITKGSKISSANHRLLLFTRFFHRNVRLVESHIKVKIFMQNFSFGMFLIKCYWFLPCLFFFFLLGCFSSVGYILNNHLLLILLYNLLPSPPFSLPLPPPSSILPLPSSSLCPSTSLIFPPMSLPLLFLSPTPLPFFFLLFLHGLLQIGRAHV